VKRARAALNKRPSQRSSADAHQNRCPAVKVTGVARAVEIILPVILLAVPTQTLRKSPFGSRYAMSPSQPLRAARPLVFLSSHPF
jgi:hypothetical protein